MSRAVVLALALGACAPSAPPPPPEPAPAPVVVNVPPPAPAPGAPAPDPRADHIRAHYTKFEYRIPMRDGVHLFTAVYVPNDAGPSKKYPFLLHRTPYGVAPYGADRYPRRLGPSAAFEQKGYIFVAQDVRGQHASEGTFVNVTPHGARPNESTDTRDTIAWLLEHVPHHNGKVGMTGISYPGFYAAAGAIDAHPALVAISPQAPVSDWWTGDDFHRNGAFGLQEAFWFFTWFGRPHPAPSEDESWHVHDYTTVDAYQFFLDLGPLSEIDATDFGTEIAFWNELRAHPDYDAYWQARNLLPNLSNIRAATLVVGGWFDTENLYGSLGVYRSIEQRNPRTTNTLVMGPWQHGGWLRTAGDALGGVQFGWPTSGGFQDLMLAFFEHHLKGGRAPALPEALVFETGANRWRRFDRWPPRGTRAETFFLGEGGTLSGTRPTGADGFDEYVSDPAKPVPYTTAAHVDWGNNPGYMVEDQRFASSRPDVLVYQTPPLEHDLTVAGPIEVELHVSTTGTDADFVVKLVDVHPGVPRGVTKEELDEVELRDAGQHMLVRGEPFRARYRDDPSKPVPMKPGEVAVIRFTLDDVFHTFQRGHRLMIHVQSSWFPFIDRNPQTFVPNIFEAKRADFVKATHRVHRAATAPSAVRLNVLPRADE